MCFLLAHAFLCFLEREFHERGVSFVNGVGISRMERKFHERNIFLNIYAGISRICINIRE